MRLCFFLFWICAVVRNVYPFQKGVGGSVVGIFDPPLAIYKNMVIVSLYMATPIPRVVGVTRMIEPKIVRKIFKDWIIK